MKILFQKKPANIYEKLICWWTRGPYFHCAFLFSDNLVIESINSIGVHMIVLDGYDHDRWDVIDVPMTLAEEDAIKVWAVKELGCKYDWWGLIWSQILRIPREDPDKWICSEFCMAGLQQVGRFLGIDPCSTSPNDCARLLEKAN